MPQRRGVSIKLFLADGSPSGLWIVEKSNWTGVALMWPRAVHTEARRRAELERPGVYVLTGPSETSSRQRLYVGEANTLRTRLDRHQAVTDFWTRAVAFTTRDSSLNTAHAKYLESRLVELAQQAQRDEVVNGNVPRRPSLSEAETDDMDAFLDEMLVIYPVLDVRGFERVEAGQADARRLSASGPGASGTGSETPEGFVVHAGSVARLTTVTSMQAGLVELRAQLIDDGVLVPQEDGLRFATDHLFSSPSSAAAVLLGRSANGRTEWKDETGRTLKQIQSESLQTD